MKHLKVTPSPARGGHSVPCPGTPSPARGLRAQYKLQTEYFYFMDGLLSFTRPLPLDSVPERVHSSIVSHHQCGVRGRDGNDPLVLDRSSYHSG